MFVAAIIPTIDEAETIGDLVRALDKTCDDVVVVDESDGLETVRAARSAGADVRWMVDEDCRPERIGLGGAYREGAHDVARDWHVVHIDAGGSHDPAEVGPMRDLAAQGFDVVIGSRFCPQGEHHGSLKRRVTSRLAASALNLISLANIDDWTSGFRVYSPKARAVLERHEFATSGHAWQIESLWVLRQAGMRIVEHPIVYKSSVSHLSANRVSEAAKLYWKLAGE